MAMLLIQPTTSRARLAPYEFMYKSRVIDGDRAPRRDLSQTLRLFGEEHVGDAGSAGELRALSSEPASGGQTDKIGGHSK